MPTPRGSGKAVAVRPMEAWTQEWRKCRYCGTPDAYQNNGASWDAHKLTCDGWKEKEETMTTQTPTKRTKKSKYALNDEQKKVVVEMVAEGESYWNIAEKVLGTRTGGAYLACKAVAVAHYGSVTKMVEARKAARDAKKPAAVKETKVKKQTVTKAEVKPDPKPTTKKRTTRRKQVAVTS